MIIGTYFEFNLELTWVFLSTAKAKPNRIVKIKFSKFLFIEKLVFGSTRFHEINLSYHAQQFNTRDIHI